MKAQPLQKIVFSIVGLVLLVLFTACAGVGTNGSTISITGTITDVNPANHSVTLSAGSQSYTINGLTDQQVQELQSQKGQTYTIQATQNSDGSYTITVGNGPVQANGQTPGTNGITPTATGASSTTGVPGSISSLVGPVQNVSSSSLTVTMPDGTALTMAITVQTNQSKLNGAPLSVGQKVKVDVTGTTTGLFAKEIKIADAGDLNDANTLDFQGTTTQAVGSDRVLHFLVGNHPFSYTLGPTANLNDFNGNAGNIASGTVVKVKVQFNGTTGSVIKVSNAND